MSLRVHGISLPTVSATMFWFLQASMTPRREGSSRQVEKRQVHDPECWLRYINKKHDHYGYAETWCFPDPRLSSKFILFRVFTFQFQCHVKELTLNRWEHSRDFTRFSWTCAILMSFPSKVICNNAFGSHQRSSHLLLGSVNRRDLGCKQ